MKVLLQPVSVDGRELPAGASVKGLPAGTIDSLQRAGLLGSRLPREPEADPTADEQADDDDLVSDDQEDDSPESDDEPQGDDASDGDGNDESGDDPDAQIPIDQLGIPSNMLEILTNAQPPITTLGEAQDYYRTKGSFEPLKGLGKVRSAELARLLGLS